VPRDSYKYCAFAPKWGVVLKKHQHPPLFLEDENFFQKSASVVPWGIEFPMVPRRPIFEKCSHLREKGMVLIFFPGLYGGLYGQNLPYKFKNRIVISRIATSKNHIELLVPGQIWDRIGDPERILVEIRPPEFSKTEFFGWRARRIKQKHSTWTATAVLLF
jgi:hypothetical protein